MTIPPPLLQGRYHLCLKRKAGPRFSVEGKGSCIKKRRLGIPQISKIVSVAAEEEKNHHITKNRVLVSGVVRKRGGVIFEIYKFTANFLLKTIVTK